MPPPLKPIIIIGAGRSGTNLLRDLLTALPGTTTWPCDEINPIWKHGNLAKTDALTAAEARPEVRAYIRQAFERRALADGADRVVEKTCANTLRVGFVDAVLPDATYVHLVRDGRDVALSAMKRWRAGIDLGYTLKKARFVPARDLPRYAGRFVGNRVRQLRFGDRRLKVWGPTFEGLETYAETHPLDETCARQWQACVDSADRGLADVPESRRVTVYYENLVQDPRGELQRVSEWLGLDAAGDHLDELLAQVSPAGVGGWRQAMDRDQHARLAAIAGAPLRRHGVPDVPETEPDRGTR